MTTEKKPESGGCAVLGFIVMIGFGAYVWFVYSKESAESDAKAAKAFAARDPSKSGAWAFVQVAVRQKLISPGTADFGSVFGEHQNSDNTVKDYGDGRYRVVGWVDSQNRLGAKLRADFFATVEYKNGTYVFLEGPELQER
jgi:hypothetical protein